MIPILRGKDVKLRGFTWADFSAFAAMWQEAEVARHIPFAPVIPSQSWARFNGNNYRWAVHGFGNWAVVGRDGEFLGTTGFFQRDGSDENTVLESGWVFASAVHGQGFGSEALQLSHEWLDRQLFGARSVCMMDPDHTASIRVAEKVGYTLLRIADDPSGKARIMERVVG